MSQASGWPVVCVGGATVDRTYQAIGPLRPGTSNPARGRRSFGGVARNVAENLARLGRATTLVSLVGADENGRALTRHLVECGVGTGHLAATDAFATAEYVAVLGPDGELAFGIADMEILDGIGIDHMRHAEAALDNAALVFADCNLPQPVLTWIAARRRAAGFRLVVDAVSQSKAVRLRDMLPDIDLLFLNELEAASLLADAPCFAPCSPKSGRPLPVASEPGRPAAAAPAAAPEVTGRAAAPGEAGARDAAVSAPEALATRLRQRGPGAIVLTCGDAGLVVAEKERVVRMPAVPCRIVDVTGAGDALIAATLSTLLDKVGLPDSCRIGLLAAALTIESHESVSPSMSAETISRHLHRLHAVG